MSRHIKSLNGSWEFTLDPDNTGLSQDWHTGASRPFNGTIHVPSTWNLIEPEYEGIAFYRRRFLMDSQNNGRKIRLCFGAVNYRADVYLNGMHLGRHDGGYTPFSFDITSHVRYDGDNILVVRVVDPPNDGTHQEVDSLRFMEIPAGKESWYVNFSGIWQDVALVMTDQSYIEDVIVRPSAVSRSIHAVVTMQSTSSPDGTLTYRVTSLDGSSILGEERRLTCVEEGASYAYMDLDLPQCELWSPENPFLYLLNITLETADGRV